MASVRSLTLFTPGLLGPVPRDLLRLPEIMTAAPSLARLLSKGRAVSKPPRAREAALAGRFEVPESSLAVGPISLYGENLEPGEAFWFRADPVHLRADRDTVALFTAVDFELTREEAGRLTAEIDQFFANEGWHMEAPAPHRWYLRVDTPPRLRTTAIGAVAARGVEASLPTGSDGRRWRALLNEAQMLLHGHPVNSDRDARGLLPVNGIWIWGGGYLPAIEERRLWQRVVSDDPFVRGLARLNGIEVSAMNGAYSANLVEEGPVFVADERMSGHLARSDFAAWVDSLTDLERDWFVPLVRALKSAAIESLCVDTGETGCWSIKSADLRRFWRRGRDLTAWIKPL